MKYLTDKAMLLSKKSLELRMFLTYMVSIVSMETKNRVLKHF